MLLAFDVGNTETTVGLFDGDALRGPWRLTTNVPRTPDELRLLLWQLVERAGVAPSAVRAVAVASVVPPVTQSYVDACAALFDGVRPVVVDARSPLPITLDFDEPHTVGADRVVNTLAARTLYRRDLIVVDLGTATTYDCITADGRFFGGVIQPGVRTSSESLFQKTSMLPATALVAPAGAIGRNTGDAIRSGVVFGAADAIDGMIRRLKAEWPTSSVPFVVATGGLSPIFRTICLEIDDIDPALTLKGLKLAHDLLIDSPAFNR